MNLLRKFHPDLQACELEDRLLPVLADLGVIVLTTGGYVLIFPSPSLLGGTPVPTSFIMTVSGGISSIQPGNITGIPSLAATGTAGSSGSAGATITVGSGANDPNVASIPLVTHNTVANDALNSAPLIGRPSGDRSSVLPAGQFYRGDVPETAPAPSSSETPGEQSSRSPNQTPVDSSPIRQGDAPRRLPSDVSGHSRGTLGVGAVISRRSDQRPIPRGTPGRPAPEVILGPEGGPVAIEKRRRRLLPPGRETGREILSSKRGGTGLKRDLARERFTRGLRT